MAMTIMNNPAAAMTLGELNKNITQVGKQLAKVASGQKINGAADDASGYAVSEKMRVRIRGLDQDIENVKTGRNLLGVAAGGIDSIVEELRNLKELALNAANDHNADTDRATLQKEYEQRNANINDIASTTNYNGKLLLDGRYGNGKIVGSSNGGSIPRPYTPVRTGVVEPNAPTVTIPSGNYTRCNCRRYHNKKCNHPSRGGYCSVYW